MSIGSDLETVWQEIGSSMTIYKRDLSVVEDEACYLEQYYEQSTEFIRQNCYSGDFQYNSAMDFGDIILVDGLYLLVLNVKKDFFEGECVFNNAFLIETNCEGRFTERTETLVNEEPVTTWNDVITNIRGLQIEEIRNPTFELTEEVLMPSGQQTLYIPAFTEVKVGQRWYPDITDDTEYYKVMNIIKRVYKNCYKVLLDKDER